jgi:DNA-binding NarL/FixJ family response regulator
VALAQSAYEALWVLHEHACVLLLIDMEIASGESWRVLQALATTHQSIPIVALLCPESEDQKELEAFGVRVILPKPVGREALLSGIRLALRDSGKSL